MRPSICAKFTGPAVHIQFGRASPGPAFPTQTNIKRLLEGPRPYMPIRCYWVAGGEGLKIRKDKKAVCPLVRGYNKPHSSTHAHLGDLKSARRPSSLGLHSAEDEDGNFVLVPQFCPSRCIPRWRGGLADRKEPLPL